MVFTEMDEETRLQKLVVVFFFFFSSACFTEWLPYRGTVSIMTFPYLNYSR